MLLLQDFLASRRLIGECLGVKLAREILDRRNDARSWAVHGIANHSEAMIPKGKSCCGSLHSSAAVETESKPI